jgi:hypothetical protein
MGRQAARAPVQLSCIWRALGKNVGFALCIIKMLVDVNAE